MYKLLFLIMEMLCSLFLDFNRIKKKKKRTYMQIYINTIILFD